MAKENIKVNGYEIVKGAKYFEVFDGNIYHCFNNVGDAVHYVKKYFKPIE